ncbi:MAG: T9SS type B sorting domain-containing protein [Flavobacteriaceae bacterium]
MKNLLYLFIFLVTFSSFAQGEANVWYFGHNAGLDFNTVPPTALVGADQGQLDTFEGCSSFSNTNGDLLFYSDGTTVWNANHVPMPNGVGLAGDSSSSQSAMIIPKPGSTTIYYIFTVGAQSSGNAGFNYYELDMSANSGLGDIVSGPVDLSAGRNTASWSEKVAAVKGDLCETFWVLSLVGNEFLAYYIDSSGVYLTPAPSTVPYFSSDPRGYLKISPDGTKVGVAHMQIGGFLIYDFDDSTGIVSNQLNLPLPSISGISSFLQPNKPYGVEFSPNSEKIFVHSSNGGPFNDNSVGAHYSSLVQFDISLPTNPEIINSSRIIDARNLYRGALQLGPDHKIYRSLSQSYTVGIPFLSVIESPNEDGAAVNYQHSTVTLRAQNSSQGLPPFIASIFSQIELTGDDGNGNTVIINDQNFDLCTGDNISIISDPLVGTPIYNWDKDGVFYANTPDISFPNVAPSDNGVYKLQAEFTDACGIISTLEGEFTLAVYDVPVAPIASALQNIIECDNNNDGTFPFDLTINDTVIINGQTGMEVVYFTTQANADNNSNSLSSPYNSGSATIYARVQSVGNTNCYDTTSFDIELYDGAFPTDIATMTPLELCDDTSIGTLNDGLVVTDLSVKNLEILNTQSSVDFTLTYFTDAGYLNQIVAPNITNYDNTLFPGGQTIYVRMTNNLNPTCFADTSFELIIYEQPLANIPPTMILCDDDNNGTMPFVLTDQDSFISTASGMTITYHPSQADADTGANPISSPFESGNTTIFSRVENDLSPTSCYDTSFFDIEVYDSAFPLDAASISPIENCDNTSVGTDTDGFILFDLTQNETAILNGQSATDFTLTYFTDAAYLNPITTPPNVFNNTGFPRGLTIYVRMINNLENSCYSDTSFEIEVFELPTILDTYLFKNCDEDGTPDGFTDYNLDEANEFITLGDTSYTVTYYLSFANADTATSPIAPSPFNNATQNTVYARIETTDGCHRVSTISLQVSTTSFPVGYSKILSSCDDDDTIDGLHIFDLSLASPDLIAQFPTGQNLTVHYYRTLADAQLEMNEIISQTDYMSENPFTQTIFVRVESGDNGDCFGLGGNLTLVVDPRPEFEIDPEAIVCLNLPPITLETYNPNDVYTYTWTGPNGFNDTGSSTTVSEGGIYTVIATSTDGNNCESFPHTVDVSESIIADINSDDVTITDDSDNNTITINNDNNNLGIGDYEFTLDDPLGFYQDEPFFENVAPGIHTIYVQDKNNCGIAPLVVAVIGFPKFFTPNNDSKNDTWQVKGVSDGFFVNSTIYIFDRFGKIIANIDATGAGWDGYYNGKTLPSDDYWFTAELIDSEGNIRFRKGHFSLIRR